MSWIACSTTVPARGETRSGQVHMKESVFEVRMLDDFAADAARLFAQWSRAAIAEWGTVHVALAGGTTPQPMYQALTQPPHRDAIDWWSIHFYQSDERPVLPEHPESNWGMAKRTLLDPLSVPANHRHRMQAEADDLDAAAIAYAKLLDDRLESPNQVPVFDLILLGIGIDGHTASLFPDTSALYEMKRAVVVNYVRQLQTPRFTLTFPVINAAREVWFLVTGANKADLLPRIIDECDPLLPASHVRPAQGRCLWLVDRAAGARMTEDVC